MGRESFKEYSEAVIVETEELCDEIVFPGTSYVLWGGGGGGAIFFWKSEPNKWIVKDFSSSQGNLL